MEEKYELTVKGVMFSGVNDFDKAEIIDLAYNELLRYMKERNCVIGVEDNKLKFGIIR